MSGLLRVVVLVLLLLVGVPTPVLAAEGHHWPVGDPEVTRPFLPPLTAWSDGHRGVDLRARPGTGVRASAAGTVTFAGAVAGDRWVTVAHDEHLRTTYGPMTRVAVEAGEDLARGAFLGTVAASDRHRGLHWSARRDGAYVDPTSLLAGSLVGSLVGESRWWPANLHDRPGYDPWDGRDTTLGFLPGTRPATAPGWLAAPTPNHVIGVPGLLTSTGSTPLPLGFLGYAPRDTTILSHAGRHDLPGDADDPWRDQVPQDAADTFEGVHRSALALRDQLRAQWAREPGVAVDLVGHSMGGVVVLHYLMALHDPADPTLPPVANVVTLASPLEGADGASAGQAALRQWSTTRAVVDLLAGFADVRLRGGTIDDLAVGSPLLRDLASAWAEASHDPHASPLATGTRVLTIGGATDVVVPEHRSDLPGADHVVVPGGHTAMHGSEATLQVVRAFLEADVLPAGDGSWGAWLSGLVSAGQQIVGHLDHP